ncbi:MAG: hypothetical protein WAK33_21790 [Silvibacterium sp.]
MQFALSLNLLGTVALFYAFQATSSNFKLVTVKDRSVLGGTQEQSAICIYGRALIVQNEGGSWSFGGGSPCPDWQHAKAAAVVNIEHPTFEGLGFALLLTGFLLQYLAVPQPKTIAQMREDLKRLRVEQKQKNLH